MRRSAAIAAASVAAGFLGAGCSIESVVNRVGDAERPAVSEAAAILHRESFVVDLHADSLLWGRDLRRRSDDGHVDLPRLREGGVAIQFFTAVTRVPMSIDIERTDERWPDLVTLLALVHGWPYRSLSSRFERVLFQAERLERLAAADGRVVLVRSREDLGELERRHLDDPG
ncbi:MAG: peptidase M19, partial [Candidatus Binatia bacterium]